MKFERKHYIEKLISSKHNHLIKIVTGLRRVGKPYLLFNLYKQHLLDTIFKYFESINTENIDSYPRNIYENNKYTGILESKELKSLFENLSPKVF